MIALLEPVAANLATTDMLMALVLDDLSDAQARQRSRDGHGPSIAWEVGHMLGFRTRVLELLGVETSLPFDVDFTTGSATAGDDYPTVDELRQTWTAWQAALGPALDAAGETALRQPVGGDSPFGGQSVLQVIAFYTFHEAYHMGALGAIRKSIGLPGPAELVMAQRS